MEQRKFRMPTAYTILFCLILLVALSTWFIPAGSYDYADGIPISGSYHAVAPAPQGIGAALKAAFRGFYDAVDVCVFILMVGGFLGVVMKTGAIDAGVSNVIARLQGKTLGGFSPTPQRCIAECGGEQVQSGRGTTGDDDLLFTFGRIRADQLGHLGSGLLKGHGATGGQLVRTTVHAGVNCTVEVRLGVDHRIRLLRGGRRIQVHERVPVNLLIQNRELRPNRLKINHYVPPTYVTIVRNEWESDMACSRP